jgi:bifunctional non-homologous end joining protein LigD
LNRSGIGEHCLAFRRGGELSLFTRKRIRLNERYPEVTAAFHRQRVDSFIADCEIVTFKDRITSFTKLQERMQVAHPSADLLRRVPVWLYLFDLLHLDRYDTRQVPLRFRKQVLRNAFNFRDSLRLTKHCETEGGGLFSKGMSQRMGGRDREERGQRVRLQENAQLAQIQVQPKQEFVIGGYTEPRRSRIGFGALLPGYYRGRNLVYAGKVGTGFDNDTLRRLRRMLGELATPTRPFDGDGLPRRGVHWVKPRLIAQIAFTEWTPGGKLRHPRFLGLREDKKPEDVVREG